MSATSGISTPQGMQRILNDSLANLSSLNYTLQRRYGELSSQSQTIMHILVVIVALVILFVILRLTLFTKNKDVPHVVNELYNTGGSKTIDAPTSNVTTYMVWFFIKNWTTNGEKYLFQDGDGTLAKLEQTMNTLHVIPVLPGMYSSPEITVSNIALQSWNCLTVMQRDRILDVYLNGKLVRSHVVDGVLPVYPEAAREFKWGKYSDPNGQANVQFGRIYIFNELTPQQVYNYYKRGPGSGTESTDAIWPFSVVMKMSSTIFPKGRYKWVEYDSNEQV